MGDDREALAEALGSVIDWEAPLPSLPPSGRQIIDALDSVVEAIARRRAAEEMRKAAEESTHWVMTRETVYTRLNDRADALEAK